VAKIAKRIRPPMTDPTMIPANAPLENPDLDDVFCDED
jgi:hypothetical protein